MIAFALYTPRRARRFICPWGLFIWSYGKHWPAWSRPITYGNGRAPIDFFTLSCLSLFPTNHHSPSSPIPHTFSIHLAHSLHSPSPRSYTSSFSSLYAYHSFHSSSSSYLHFPLLIPRVTPSSSLRVAFSVLHDPSLSDSFLSVR